MKSLGLKEYIAIAVGIVLIAFIFLFGGGFSLFGPEDEGVSSNINSMTSQESFSNPSVSIEEVTVGNGTEAVSGSSVEVHYRLTLSDGLEVDSSYGRGVPLPFILGSGQVIPGFDQAVLGMKVGGKRKVTIPPELGYGSNPVGPIPANSTLFFEVELVEVK